MTAKGIFLFLFFLNFSYAFSADCPRAKEKEKCLGECGSFTDKNSNKTCDDWDKAHKIVRQIDKNDKKEIASAEMPKSKKKETLSDKLLKYGFYWYFLIPSFAVLISEKLKRKEFYRIIHKDLWNNILFFSFFICALSGFSLYFLLLGDWKNMFFKIHLFSSAVCFISSFYHFAERISCMFPFKKCR
ncbi:MAG: hypothetical protein GX447_08415 [Elusimicrobia bacterium]|nr:hypothetical protein [Elusimicrobiota bacterium]